VLHSFDVAGTCLGDMGVGEFIEYEFNHYDFRKSTVSVVVRASVVGLCRFSITEVTICSFVFAGTANFRHSILYIILHVRVPISHQPLRLLGTFRRVLCMDALLLEYLLP